MLAQTNPSSGFKTLKERQCKSPNLGPTDGNADSLFLKICVYNIIVLKTDTVPEL